ncbi:MAG: TIGR03862 family flavoprotein [Cytophagales bacterium]|nr:TIGR03862 family flavoprotein [Rhizobacter sp.]
MTSPAHLPRVAPRVAIIGGGPAGLMVAEVLAQGGAQVDVYDGMPSVGRKFLLAGKGGLNLTHSEAAEPFLSRYGKRQAEVAPWLQAFGAQQVREWVHALGLGTFVGSSGRVFPTDMKAAPLLRAWLQRLRASGVRFHMRHRWLGWEEGAHHALRFASPQGEQVVTTEAVVLALGGASWPRLGSDGMWLPWLQARGVALAALQPSNCGFDIGWSEHFRSRYAGQPLKSVGLSFKGIDGAAFSQVGEFIATESGVEGSLVYAASSFLRDEIATQGSATMHIDLLPGRSLEWVRDELAHPRGPRSLSTHLKARLGLHGVKAGLMHEVVPREAMNEPARLARLLKALPVKLLATRPIDEAISSAGGVRFEALDERLMLRELPGVFCAGEMLDWEAPTGGYLLTACFASARVAGAGALRWLAASETSPVGP